MVSQYVHEAWANFGPGMARALEGFANQRQQMAEFKAQIAMAELQRRDRLEAQKEANEIDLELLRIKSEESAANVKYQETMLGFNEDKIAQQARGEKVLGDFLKRQGAKQPGDIGTIAGGEWKQRISEAAGPWQKFKAAATGFAPAIRTGVEQAQPRDITAKEFIKGRPSEDATLLYKQMPEAFETREIPLDMYFTLGVPFENLPADWKAVEGLKTGWDAAITEKNKLKAMGTEEAELRLQDLRKQIDNWERIHLPQRGPGPAPKEPTPRLKQFAESMGRSTESVWDDLNASVQGEGVSVEQPIYAYNEEGKLAPTEETTVGKMYGPSDPKFPELIDSWAVFNDKLDKTEGKPVRDELLKYFHDAAEQLVAQNADMTYEEAYKSIQEAYYQ